MKLNIISFFDFENTLSHYIFLNGKIIDIRRFKKQIEVQAEITIQHRKIKWCLSDGKFGSEIELIEINSLGIRLLTWKMFLSWFY